MPSPLDDDPFAVIAPADASSGQELLDRADQRPLYRKRLNKSAL